MCTPVDAPSTVSVPHVPATRPQPARRGWLRPAAVATLMAFGPVACGSWKTVPLTRIASGEEQLAGVTVRLHERDKLLEQWRPLVVTAVRFPLVEGHAPDSDVIEQVDLRSLDSVEVYSTDAAATVFAVVGVAAVVLLAAAIIAVATKSSCPFVYAETPEGPVLVGESYSGATNRSIQRADLLPLPALEPGRARLRLANEAYETQYTDQLELWLVDHAPGTRAVATYQARPILVSGGAPPARALDLAGAEVTSLVARKDALAWQSDLDVAARLPVPPSREGIEATFPAPPPGTRPVLELDLGNAPWLDVVFGRFFALMGDDLEASLERGNRPEAGPAIRAWREREGVDLAVDLWRAGRWERVALIPTVGPVALRRVAVPLPASSGEEVRVRLIGGVGFWRVDALALSALADDRPPAVRLAPAAASGTGAAQARDLLAAEDGRYHVLAVRGESMALSFDTPPPPPGSRRDAFLLTNGYYLVHRPPQAERSLATLRTLRDEPGSLSRFSLDLYREYQKAAAAPRLAGAAP